MKFEYAKISKFIRHQKTTGIIPWIRFGIYRPGDPKDIVYPQGLVDSGSDVTIVNPEFAEELGINIKKGQRTTIHGIGGGAVEGYIHPIGYFIQDAIRSERPIVYTDDIIFSTKSFPPSMPTQTAILGTVGFFRHVDVILKYPKEIIIKSKDK